MKKTNSAPAKTSTTVHRVVSLSLNVWSALTLSLIINYNLWHCFYETDLHSQKKDNARLKMFTFFSTWNDLTHTEVAYPQSTSLEFLSDLIFICLAQLLWYKKEHMSYSVFRGKLSEPSDLHPTTDWPNPAQNSRGLTLARCQTSTKACLSVPSTARQGRKKDSWVEIRSRKNHSPSTKLN